MASDEEGNKGNKRESEESAEGSANKHLRLDNRPSTSSGITHVEPDEEGNKGNKRKSEESAEGSANKHLRLDNRPLTSSGITHVEPENVREINWMKCIKIDETKSEPQCTFCKEYYPLYIDSSIMKIHLEVHNLIEENESPDWIFRYYKPESEEYIKCRICTMNLEVPKFEGPFVDHFEEPKHNEKVEQKRLEDNEDPKKFKMRRTMELVTYLQKVFKRKNTKQGNKHKKKYKKSEEAKENVREINWMKCVNIDNWDFKPQCTICKKYYSLYFDSSTMKSHLKVHNIVEKSESPDWIFRHYELAKGKYINCRKCKMNLEVPKFTGPFVDHFEDPKHNEKAEQTRLSDNEDAEVFKTRRTTEFALYLFDVFKRKGTIKGITVQENVKPISWMKSVNLGDFKAIPHCNICNEYHTFHIDSSIFNNHLRDIHDKTIEEEVESSPDWIFCYYTPVQKTHFISCNMCAFNIEVSEFKGSFVDHFFKDPKHAEIAEQRSQGNEKNAEEEKLHLTSRFVNYLYDVFKTKAVYDVRYKGWWMEYVGTLENNQLSCGFTGCPTQDIQHNFHAYFHLFNFENHVRSHHADVQLRKNQNIWDYISFDNYLLRCKLCHEILYYYFKTDFIAHLETVHNIESPSKTKAIELIKEVKHDDTIVHFQKLIKYLVKSFWHKLIEQL